MEIDNRCLFIWCLPEEAAGLGADSDGPNYAPIKEVS